MQLTISKRLCKRRSKRLRVFLRGSLVSSRGEQAVRVRDISEGGVLVEAEHTPGVGERVTLSCSGHELTGTVIWHRGSWSGIEFERPLRPAVWRNFARVMRVGAPRQYRHDLEVADEEQLEWTPRVIRMRVPR